MSPGMPMDAADGRGRGRRTGAEALLLSRVDVSACFAARSVSRDRGFGAGAWPLPTASSGGLSLNLSTRRRSVAAVDRIAAPFSRFTFFFRKPVFFFFGPGAPVALAAPPPFDGARGARRVGGFPGPGGFGAARVGGAMPLREGA